MFTFTICRKCEYILEDGGGSLEIFSPTTDGPWTMNCENSGLGEIVKKKIQIRFLFLLLCGNKSLDFNKEN
jgi:hypothetical protein